MSSGHLKSLYVGDGKVASPRDLCLHHDTTGVLELTECGPCTTVWEINTQTHRMSIRSSASCSHVPAPSTASCLVGLNTSRNDIDPWTKSAGNCSTAPHSLLPYCDTSLPVDERVANVLSHSYMTEMPQGFGRLGFPMSPPTGECLHGFVHDCLDDETCATSFPAAIASASSFNDTLFSAIGAAISIEGRAITNYIAAEKNPNGDKGHSICWSPNINPFRWSPVWTHSSALDGHVSASDLNIDYANNNRHTMHQHANRYTTCTTAQTSCTHTQAPSLGARAGSAGRGSTPVRPIRRPLHPRSAGTGPPRG